MSEENVDVIRRGFEHFAATGDVHAEITAPDFVWDMSKFHGWPEQQTYEGVDGARQFLRDWVGAWDDWELNVDSYREVGDKVVTIMRQRGRSKSTGLEVDMTFAMVWTVRDGKQAYMEMYADPQDALEAAASQA
jgi:ketosteroid isomerase-like protein